MSSMRYKIILSYDGTDFCGWQSQPNGASVQNAVENAAAKLFGHKTVVVGSGRTDAGVHALRQVAHFDSDKVLPVKNVIGGLNAYLPSSIRVIGAEHADGGFDARKSAKKKTYMYLMYGGDKTPLLDKRALFVGDVDAAAMSAAAKGLIGTHDFSTFKAAGSGAKTSTRTVYDATVDKRDGFTVFKITANGFLYNMVRIIAARLIRIGKGAADDIPDLIVARDRNAAKDTAPGYALYLYDVEYDSQEI